MFERDILDTILTITEAEISSGASKKATDVAISYLEIKRDTIQDKMNPQGVSKVVQDRTGGKLVQAERALTSTFGNNARKVKEYLDTLANALEQAPMKNVKDTAAAKKLRASVGIDEGEFLKNLEYTRFTPFLGEDVNPSKGLAGGQPKYNEYRNKAQVRTPAGMVQGDFNLGPVHAQVIGPHLHLDTTTSGIVLTLTSQQKAEIVSALGIEG